MYCASFCTTGKLYKFVYIFMCKTCTFCNFIVETFLDLPFFPSQIKSEIFNLSTCIQSRGSVVFWEIMYSWIPYVLYIISWTVHVLNGSSSPKLRSAISADFITDYQIIQTAVPTILYLHVHVHVPRSHLTSRTFSERLYKYKYKVEFKSL